MSCCSDCKFFKSSSPGITAVYAKPLVEINYLAGKSSSLNWPDIKAIVFDMLSQQKENPVFTGGLEAKRLKLWHAERLKDLKTTRLFFAYDTVDDYEYLVHARDTLNKAQFKISHRVGCYVLVGYDGDSINKAVQRLKSVLDLGFYPMAMLFKNRDRQIKQDTGWRFFVRQWARPTIIYHQNRTYPSKKINSAINNCQFLFDSPKQEINE